MIETKATRPQVVTVCGSTRFKEETTKIVADLEIQGYVVLSVGSFMHADGMEFPIAMKAALDILHLRKIEMSDMVLVVNPGGYVGESTRREIEYAKSIGVPVTYSEELDQARRIGSGISESRDVDGVDVRPAVLRFAREMEVKLRENDHKRQWDTYNLNNINWFTRKMKEEVQELDEALAMYLQAIVEDKPANKVIKLGKAVIKEAADIGNFAMMTADIISKEVAVDGCD